jgi:hypothetical protein
MYTVKEARMDEDSSTMNVYMEKDEWGNVCVVEHALSASPHRTYFNTMQEAAVYYYALCYPKNNPTDPLIPKPVRMPLVIDVETTLKPTEQ